MTERKIIIGLITNTPYIQQIRQNIKIQLLESATAKLICSWTLDYFDEYKKAPNTAISSIFFEELKKNTIPKELAEEIEEDILPELNDEYINEDLDIDYLIDITRKYFQERELILLQQNFNNALEKNDLQKAEKLIEKHKQKKVDKNQLIFNSDNINSEVKTAFNKTYESVINYPGMIGKFWNLQMVRGGFVAFMGPEKRGKTTLLIDAAMRAVFQKKKVAFFQAGDMTQNQFVKRVAMYLLRKTDKEKYVGKNYILVKDCIKNQLNICDKKIRECDFGVFEDRNWNEKMLRNEVTKEDLIEAYKDNPTYKPCYNCSEYNEKNWGACFIKEDSIKQLTVFEAEKKVEEWFLRKNRQLRVSTYANGMLTIPELKAVLNNWEIADNFIPDVLIIDYADLLVPTVKQEFRHQQNQIWKDLRGLNQELNCLLLTATMTDAKSYKQNLINLDNYNEDKRKYGHVTAMYGLNQDPDGREKRIGLMRINPILLRDDEFDTKRCITILQELKYWRPILSSYF